MWVKSIEKSGLQPRCACSGISGEQGICWCLRTRSPPPKELKLILFPTCGLGLICTMVVIHTLLYTFLLGWGVGGFLMVSCFLCCRCFGPFCSLPVYSWVLLLSIYSCFLSIKKKYIIFCSSRLQNIYKLHIRKCLTFTIFTLLTKETKIHIHYTKWSSSGYLVMW